jgi:hypothetical protein
MKDGKKVLADIYYDETAMNKWRDTCQRGNESLKIKFEKVDKDFTLAREKILSVDSR